MRVYFYVKLNKEQAGKNQQVLDVLQKFDLQLTSNILPQGSFDEEVAKSFFEAGLSILSQLDALVIEVTQVDQQVSYFLAQAILQKKPVLCLYQKNKSPRSLLMFLKQKNIPRTIKIKAYTDASLHKTVTDFLHSIKGRVEEIEIPSIRFTLRLTPQLDKYLNFAVHGKKITKADYLREMLKNKMASDEKFQSSNK